MLCCTHTPHKEKDERERYGVDLEEDTSRDKVVVNKVDKVVGVLDVGDDLVRERLMAVQTGPVGPQQHECLVLGEEEGGEWSFHFVISQTSIEKKGTVKFKVWVNASHKYHTVY